MVGTKLNATYLNDLNVNYFAVSPKPLLIADDETVTSISIVKQY